MKRNYARFYTLLNRCQGIDKEELKEELIRQYSKKRTTSLKEVTDKEYDAICNALQEQLTGQRSRDLYREQLREKRSAALHQMQKMGIDTTDWDRINAYCLNPRIAGQPFGKLTVEELETLCTKLRLIQRKEKENNQNNTLSN